MYPNWDKFNGVSLAEQYANREQLQARAEVAREVVNGAEQIVNEVVHGPELIAQVDHALATGALTAEQAAQMRAALQNEQARQQIVTKTITWKDRASNFKDWVVDRAPAFIAGAVAGGAARKAVKVGAIAAFGANLPVAIAAGALGGGLVEGIKTAWRESKSYRTKDIMERFNNAGDLDKAAMLAKIEQLHAEQRLEASPEEYLAIGNALAQARAQMQLSVEGRDNRYANMSERDKIAYILHITDKNRKDVMKLEDKNRMKESKALIKALNKEIESKHDKSFARLGGKKAVVGKAIFKGAAFGALGGTIGAAVVDYFSGPSSETISRVVEQKPTVSESFHAHMDHRGITGGARDSLHTLIEQQRGIDPEFAKGINVEQLVYAEDTLAKDALRAGVNPGVESMTWSKDELMGALEKSGAIPDDATLTEAGQQNISEVIKTKAHFLSEATKAKMLDFDPAEARTFIEEVSVDRNDSFTYEDYAALAGVLAAILASEAISYADRDKAAAKLRTLYYNVPGLPGRPPEGVAPTAGGEYVAPTPVFRTTEGRDVNRTQPEDQPIPRPEGVPFDRAENSEDAPIAKPEGTPFNNEEKSDEDDQGDKNERFPNGAPPSPFTHPEGVNPEAQDNEEQNEEAEEATEGEQPNEEGTESKPKGPHAKFAEKLNKELQDAKIPTEVKLPRGKLSEKDRNRIEYLTDEFILNSERLDGLDIPHKVVLDFYPKGERKLGFNQDNEIVVGVPFTDKQINGKSMLKLAKEIVKLKVEDVIQGVKELYGQVLTKSERKRLNKLPVENQLRAANMLLEAHDKKAMEKVLPNVRGYLKESPLAEEGENIIEGEFIDIVEDKNEVESVPEKEEQLTSAEIPGYSNIFIDERFDKVDNKQQVFFKDTVRDILDHEFLGGLNPDLKIVLSNQFSVKDKTLYLDANKSDWKHISGRLHSGIRLALKGGDFRTLEPAKDYASKAKRKKADDEYQMGQPKFRSSEGRDLNQEKEELQDSNTPDRIAAEKFADSAVKELFDTDVNLVDLKKGDTEWQQWIDEERLNLDRISSKKISNTQKKKIESHLGKKKITIESLLDEEAPPEIAGVKPNTVKRYIAEAALNKLEEIINDPADLDEEFNSLRNKTEEYLERKDK
ncbi:hypothetical protein IPM19_01350 [bacterium]|nr:MAG: hypothetical protein IPM19_01350 [bacterium]